MVKNIVKWWKIVFEKRKNVEIIKPDIRLVFLPCPGFNLLPFSGFMDAVRHTSDEELFYRQRYCNWTVTAPTLDPISSSSGIQVLPDSVFEEINLENTDYVLVFGGLIDKIENIPKTYATFLKEADSQGKKIVGFDNGTFLIAQAGLLNGHTVVIHWRHRIEFLERYPDIHVITDALYLYDGNRITCPGGTAAIDLAIEILSYHCGYTRAIRGLGEMLVDEKRGIHHEIKSLKKEFDPFTDKRVIRAINLMRQNLSFPKPKNWIGREIGISGRQLDRLFKAHYNKSVAEYWLDMRLQHSCWRLTNSIRTITEVAYECGFSDCSHFGRRFKKEFGVAPLQYRTDNLDLSKKE